MTKRQEKYLDQVVEQSISIFYSGVAPVKSADQRYPFSVNKDFYYLTNLDLEDVYLVLIKGNGLKKSYIFAPKFDPVKALWDGAALSYEEINKISGVELINIRPIEQLDGFIAGLLTSNRRAIFGQINHFYFDFDRSDFNGLQTITEKMAHDIVKRYPFIKLNNAHPILADLRTTKDADEINAIKGAIDISAKAYDHLLKVIPNLDYEYEVEAEYNYILNKNLTTPSFASICASGVNATTLHYVNNDQKLDKEGLILLDLGVEYQNYASDITRTYPVSGKFTKRQKEVYEAVLAVNKEVINWVRAGITIEEFNNYGKKLLTEAAHKLGLITSDDEIGLYYYHSLGHYLGLDVHDEANYSKVIEPGTIITVEPGLYISKEKIGVRIEDDVLITEDKAINLSSMIVKEVAQIEQLMKKSK